MTAEVAPSPVLSPIGADGRVAYTIAEAARKLGKSTRTLRKLYEAGQMPAKPLGATLMVPASWVEAFGLVPQQPAPIAKAVA